MEIASRDLAPFQTGLIDLHGVGRAARRPGVVVGAVVVVGDGEVVGVFLVGDGGGAPAGALGLEELVVIVDRDVFYLFVL